eukprot:1894963-Prymnesium_polylepis.1
MSGLSNEMSGGQSVWSTPPAQRWRTSVSVSPSPPVTSRSCISPMSSDLRCCLIASHLFSFFLWTGRARHQVSQHTLRGPSTRESPWRTPMHKLQRCLSRPSMQSTPTMTLTTSESTCKNVTNAKVHAATLQRTSAAYGANAMVAGDGLGESYIVVALELCEDTVHVDSRQLLLHLRLKPSRQ